MAKSKEPQKLEKDFKTDLSHLKDSTGWPQDKAVGAQKHSVLLAGRHVLAGSFYKADPTQQKTMAEYLLSFAESESNNMTMRQLFLFMDALIEAYLILKRDGYSTPIMDNMIDGLKNICLKKMQPSEAVNLLTGMISSGKPASDEAIETVLQTLYGVPGPGSSAPASSASTTTTLTTPTIGPKTSSSPVSTSLSTEKAPSTSTTSTASTSSYSSAFTALQSSSSSSTPTESTAKTRSTTSYSTGTKISTGNALTTYLGKCIDSNVATRSDILEPSMKILELFYKNVTPQQQKAMAERVLLCAEHEMTGKQLFLFTEAFIRHYQDWKADVDFGDSPMVNQIIEGLKNICARNINFKEPIDVLSETIQTGKPVDDAQFNSALKSLERKVITPNTTQESDIQNARTTLTQHLQSYDATLPKKTGHGRHDSIQKALVNGAKVSNDEFLTNFMIAHRICEYLEKPEDRKTVLFRIFPENDLFRPFAELFASSEIKKQAKGATVSTLENIFETFKNSFSSMPQSKTLNNNLEKAITDKVTESLIKVDINKTGDVVNIEPQLLRVLKNLIYVEQIDPANAASKSNEAVFKTLISEFAANYFMKGGINPAEGVKHDSKGFLQYFSEIIAEAKHNTTKAVIGEQNLNNCLAQMEKLANEMDFQFSYNTNVDYDVLMKYASSTQPAVKHAPRSLEGTTETVKAETVSDVSSRHRSIHDVKTSSSTSTQPQVESESEKVSTPKLGGTPSQ